MKKIIFTPIGFAVLIITMTILIRSLYIRNAYEIVLSSAALFLLLCLGGIGFWKSKKLSLLEVCWKLPQPMTAIGGACGELSQISGLNVPVPLFFRLHFAVRGKFFPCGEKRESKKISDACFVYTETSAARGENTASLHLDFPMSGVFNGKGYCSLRDIFGFFSFHCGIDINRIVKIRSAPCFGKKHLIKAQSGAEDRRNKHSTDEERYYMREYTPGDRFRDINWKSSEKIDTLITRISPDNQDKVSRIEILFCNYGPADKPSLEALWLLDRAKARLAFFLRSLKEEQPSYIFDVKAGGGSWEIDDSESLENFLDDLAALSFTSAQNEALLFNTANRHGELYVFSTACYKGLSAFLQSCAPRPVSLFLVQPGNGQKTEREIFYKRNFLTNGIFPQLHWLSCEKIKPQAGGEKKEIFYAETKL